MRKTRVAAVQFQHAHADKEANLAVIERFCAGAAEDGVEIICFPECCISGYWTLRKLSREELEALAEPVPDGPSSRRLMELAKRHNMTVGAGVVEITPTGELYNTYVVAMPDGRFASHRKLHCFISEHMLSGNEYTVFDTPHGCRVGVLICYDNNIGENARMTALRGADILLAPHQTGGCNSPDPHTMGLVDKAKWADREADPAAIEAELRGPKGRGWLMRWLPARAHDNGMFLVFSNGVGPDGDEIRTGNAMVLDTYGRVLAETCKAGDAMVAADLDPALRERCTGVRWISTRRPDLYAPLAQPTGKEVETRVSRFDGEGV